jgi:hypothetical protein
MGEIPALEPFQFVAFYTAEKPAYFDAAQPGTAAKQLAADLFGINLTDLDPAHPGKFYGKGKYGFTFEVHLKTSVALVLAAKNDLQVLNVYQ